MTSRASITGLSLVVVAALSGCGRDGPAKVEVSGQISYAGEAVANGEIMFYPINGTKGPVSGAPIEYGKYRVTNKGGVPLGEHRVVIRGFRPSPPPTEKELMNKEYAGRRRDQYIPSRYSDQTRSELRVTIGTDRESATQDFHLE